MPLDPHPFLGSFFEEVSEHLAHMDTTLQQLERPPHDRELFSSLLIATNAIRGTSSMFDFPELTRFAHVMEGLLGQLQDGKIPPSQELIHLLSRAAQTLKGEVRAAQQGEASPSEADAVRGELERAIVHCVLVRRVRPTTVEVEAEISASTPHAATDAGVTLFS